ncbi:MAG: hypothetical protein PHQ22_09145, partial [Sulfuricurvum sp.]|nr:hypothetical protein [Sulfuricurvum sp.]
MQYNEFESDFLREMNGKSKDFIAYNEAKEKDTIEAYKGYLSKYPNGMYRQEAEEKIKSIIENDNKAFELAT